MFIMFSTQPIQRPDIFPAYNKHFSFSFLSKEVKMKMLIINLKKCMTHESSSKFLKNTWNKQALVHFKLLAVNFHLQQFQNILEPD